jgi:hypothetical protein
MNLGISGAPIPISLKYAAPIQKAADDGAFWPLFAYAIAWRETISSELSGYIQANWPGKTALDVITGDNGHGLCQVTPAAWWGAPITAAWAAIDWTDAEQNMAFGIEWFLNPAVDFWHGQEGFIGSSLIRLVASEYNAGRDETMKAHEEGDVDRADTNNYASGIEAIYNNLLTRGVPA